MTPRPTRVALLAVALLLGLVATACSTGDDRAAEIQRWSGGVTSSGSSYPQPETRTAEPGSSANGEPRVIGTVATGLAAPWGVAFLPDGSALVGERDTARVLAVAPRAVADGGAAGDAGAVPREVGQVAIAAPQGEGGLLGLAVSPDFDQDSLVYAYVTTAEDNRVVTMTYDGSRLGPPRTVLAGIPVGFIHNGGRLAFGPDGYLYISTGETGDEELAQDPDSLAGKVLRVTLDGDAAPGNPVAGSPVWTVGHRNVEGLAFDDEDRLWASEFGANTWDELNQVVEGRNYGWPLVEGGGDPEFANPSVQWRTAEASPPGVAYLDGALWVTALRGERLWRVPMRADGSVGRPEDFLVGDYGRLRTVVAAPDGSLWVTTSNRDSRGTPRPGDDQILVVDPG